MGISRHKLAATNNRLVGANGAQIKLDDAVFLNLTVGNTMSSQIVTCLFLSQKTCKEPCAVHPDLPVQAGLQKI